MTIPLRIGNTKRNVRCDLHQPRYRLRSLGFGALTGMKSAFITPSANPLKHHVSLPTKEAKELNPPPPQQQRQQQNRPGLLAAQNRVLGCLGDAEFDHPFCSNLDGLAGCWISTHACFSIHQNNLAQSRNREGVLGVLVCEGHQSFHGLHGLFLCQANGFRE